MRCSSLPAFAVLLVSLLGARPSAAYPGEVDGWGGVRWGAPVKQLLKARPGLKKRGYRLGGVLAGLRRSEGGIFLDETITTYGQEEAALRWYIRKGFGVFKAEINLQDSAPNTTLSGPAIRKILEAAYGPGGTDRERRNVWPGQTTVVVLEARTMLAGADVTVTHMQRAEWEETPVKLPEGWADKARAAPPAVPEAPPLSPSPTPTATAPPPAAPSTEAPAPAPAPSDSTGPTSAVEQVRDEAAARLKARDQATRDREAKARDIGLPDLEEAGGLLDPSVE